MEGVAAVGNLSNGITPSIGVSPMRLSLTPGPCRTSAHSALSAGLLQCTHSATPQLITLLTTRAVLSLWFDRLTTNGVTTNGWFR